MATRDAGIGIVRFIFFLFQFVFVFLLFQFVFLLLFVITTMLIPALLRIVDERIRNRVLILRLVSSALLPTYQGITESYRSGRSGGGWCFTQRYLRKVRGIRVRGDAGDRRHCWSLSLDRLRSKIISTMRFGIICLGRKKLTEKMMRREIGVKLVAVHQGRMKRGVGDSSPLLLT